MRNFRLWEQGHPVALLAPAADPGGRTSSFVSLANAHKGFLICHIAQGSAAPVTLTPMQAQDQTGTGAKGLSQAAPIAYNLNCQGPNSDLLTIGPAASSFTTDDAAASKLVMFEINASSQFDLAGPPAYSFVGITTGPSNAANVTAVWLLILGLRYAQQSPPSAQAPAGLVEPGEVQNFAVSNVTGSSAMVTWLPPATGNPPVFTYLLEQSTNGGDTFNTVWSDAMMPTLVAGLTAGETVTLRISAQNAAGFGPPATITFTASAGSGSSSAADDSGTILFGPGIS